MDESDRYTISAPYTILKKMRYKNIEYIMVLPSTATEFMVLSEESSLDSLVQQFVWPNDDGEIQIRENYSFERPALFPQESINQKGVMTFYMPLSENERNRFRTALKERVEYSRKEALRRKRTARGHHFEE